MQELLRLLLLHLQGVRDPLQLRSCLVQHLTVHMKFIHTSLTLVSWKSATSDCINSSTQGSDLSLEKVWHLTGSIHPHKFTTCLFEKSATSDSISSSTQVYHLFLEKVRHLTASIHPHKVQTCLLKKCDIWLHQFIHTRFRLVSWKSATSDCITSIHRGLPLVSRKSDIWLHQIQPQLVYHLSLTSDCIIFVYRSLPLVFDIRLHHIHL